MNADAAPSRPASLDAAGFRAFYDRQLPVVFGYLLRLCGGDRTRAEDLTQDVWIQLVDELAAGRSDRADIRWLLTVARSRYLDAWRRDQRSADRLRLAWDGGPQDDGEPHRSDVLEHVASLDPAPRAAMVLHYLDGLPVAEVARLLGRSTDATYSLLARARRDLRSRLGGDHGG